MQHFNEKLPQDNPSSLWAVMEIAEALDACFSTWRKAGMPEDASHKWDWDDCEPYLHALQALTPLLEEFTYVSCCPAVYRYQITIRGVVLHLEVHLNEHGRVMWLLNNNIIAAHDESEGDDVHPLLTNVGRVISDMDLRHATYALPIPNPLMFTAVYMYPTPHGSGTHSILRADDEILAAATGDYAMLRERLTTARDAIRQTAETTTDHGSAE
jgi:hypothetical protein